MADNATVYGKLAAGQTWIPSGPFSGCYMEVGKMDGRVHSAHISCEGGNNPAKDAWESQMPNRTVLFSKKIGMAADLPVGAMKAEAIFFLHLQGETVKAVRVDFVPEKQDFPLPGYPATAT